MYRRKVAFVLLQLFILISLVTGCTNQEPTSQPKQQKNSNDDVNPPLSKDDPIEKVIVPLSLAEGEFGSIVGWLNNDTIVYFINSGQSSTVFSYELFTGKSTVIYESEHPIISIYLSDSKERLLVHTAPTSFEGKMTIIDQKGTILATESIVSSEITFAWNPFNEDLVLITSFTEDWNFQVSLFDSNKKQLQELSVSQPFANWLSKDELIYLGWDVNTISLFAPLVKQSIFETNGEPQQQNDQNIFQLYSFKNVVATISVSEDKENAIYSFFTDKLEPIETLTIPHLTKFSDWLVPFNDVNHKQMLFYTLRPLISGEADSYKEGFELVAYQLGEGKEQLIMRGLENKPISCSPNGEYCLYGFQFEDIIDLQAKKMIELVQEKK